MAQSSEQEARENIDKMLGLAGRDANSSIFFMSSFLGH